MNFLSVITEVIDEPRDFISRTKAGWFGWAGFLGYGLGIFSLFVFLRLFSAVPPYIHFFIIVFLLALAANFFLAGSMHLFLQMTGCEGDALKLFLLFGLTELFWAVLIPLGFLAKLGYLNPAMVYMLCLAFILIARIALVRRLYSISRGKALLALSLPYAAVISVFFMAFVYSTIYLVWLVQ
ncbi:MAG: hypothetical protein HY796_12700 [Elusimicrobia bacterium]|nr:hypothetical protein [Elusimicrobiota bacterium]